MFHCQHGACLKLCCVAESDPSAVKPAAQLDAATEVMPAVTASATSSVIEQDPVPGAARMGRPARHAVAERRPLPSAHTVSSAFKRKGRLAYYTQPSLEHLRPLASLKAPPPPPHSMLHIAVTGAAMTAEQLCAVSQGLAPQPFPSEPIDAGAIWVPPTSAGAGAFASC
jgi:hypothetical protein